MGTIWSWRSRYGYGWFLDDTIFPAQVDFELGSAVFPYPENGVPATNMGGEQIFVFKTTKEKEDACWEFIKWFTSTEVQIDWDKATGFIPVKKICGNK